MGRLRPTQSRNDRDIAGPVPRRVAATSNKKPIKPRGGGRGTISRRLNACGSTTGESLETVPNPRGRRRRRRASARIAIAAEISGAGASFPYPVYAKWADAYKKATGVGLNYQSIGSGGGIKQIYARTVTFGATDAPLKGPDLEKHGLAQFPMVMGGIVPVVNVPGIKPGQLVLDGPTLANIFLGEIKTWDDPAIAKLNPGVKLPKQAIAIVHRSDGSGTTFNFAYYLAEVSPTWKTKVGVNTSVRFPAGIGAKGNEGVANNVANTQGSIGYVEYAYALQNKLSYARMINKAGKTVAPTSEAFQAAAANADWKSRAGLRRAAGEPAGRCVVADHGADLDPDLQAAEGRRHRRARPSSSSPGPMPTAARWPTSSTMFRCPPTWSRTSRTCGRTEIKDAEGQADLGGDELTNVANGKGADAMASFPTFRESADQQACIANLRPLELRSRGSVQTGSE